MEAVLNYLRRDPAFHMNILDPLIHGDAELLYGAADGALILERESGIYMMSAENEDAADRMIAMIPSCGSFVCHQQDYVERARQKFGLQTTLECVASVYLADRPAAYRGLYDIRPLTPEHLRTVRAHYHNVDDEDYMRARLEQGQMWGAFSEEGLMGFIGIHAEKSMGMLEVFPEFRRRHVASELQGWLINHVREQGRTPFCQVFLTNEPSILLQKSLGMTVTSERMYWLC